jgi:hypothetical protein
MAAERNSGGHSSRAGTITFQSNSMRTSRTIAKVGKGWQNDPVFNTVRYISIYGSTRGREFGYSVFRLDQIIGQ